MSFLAPGRLWLLLLVPLLVVGYVLLQWRRKKYAMRFTNLALLGRVAPRRPGWRRHVAVVLTMVTVALLVTAFARPQTEVQVPRERATIVVVMDVSLSMLADDVEPSRIKAAQESAKTFVESLPDKFNVSLVSFAGSASILVSPTVERPPVLRAIDNLQLAESTATGEAIFTALEAIKQVPADPANPDERPPARIVLMSDGYKNVGRNVEDAITAANEAGVPIYTIAFGTQWGTVEIQGQRTPVPVDVDTMRKIADETGANSYTAESSSELDEVYADVGSSVGYTTEEQEVTARWTGFALLAALATAAVTLLFFGRLP